MEKVCAGSGWLRQAEDKDLWESAALVLSRRRGGVEVRWVRGHADGRKAKVALDKNERGNVRADAICNMFRGVRMGAERLQLPRAHSWRLHWDGRELVRNARKDLGERMSGRKVLEYFEVQRGWGEQA